MALFMRIWRVRRATRREWLLSYVAAAGYWLAVVLCMFMIMLVRTANSPTHSGQRSPQNTIQHPVNIQPNCVRAFWRSFALKCLCVSVILIHGIEKCAQPFFIVIADDSCGFNRVFCFANSRNQFSERFQSARLSIRTHRINKCDNLLNGAANICKNVCENFSVFFRLCLSSVRRLFRRFVAAKSK